MSRIYTYSFNASIPNLSGGSPGYFGGSLSVDYDNYVGSSGSYLITQYNLTFNGAALVPAASGGVTSTLDTDNNNIYRVSFGNPNNNYLTNLDFNYKTENPISAYNFRASEFVVLPPSNMQNQYASSNLPVTTFAPVCFSTGTSILVSSGEVPVERLSVGDRVITVSGAARPVRWIGHRTVRCQGRKDLQPVRIAKDAFGPNRPARDILVSPGHSLCVDLLGEVLIPACRLINGTTITQVEVGTITYWHVELDSHDILLAEGLPAESYLDCGNRRFFANAAATDLLAAPDARPEGPPPFCRPFHEAGPLVELVRARLQERAEALGWHRVEETFAGLHLVADGETIRPDIEGLTARFVLPAAARAVRLVSETSVPAYVLSGSTDDRRLGLPLTGLTLDDGLTGLRRIALDDPRLGVGLRPPEADGAASWRWTDGATLLSPSLWRECRGTVFLGLTLAMPALPRWVAPGVETDTGAWRRQA